MDVKELLDKVAQNLSVGRAFGAAYEKGGVTVVPVALVVGGGGGGGGEGPVTPGVTGDTTENSDVARRPKFMAGAGGGFGGVVIPLGAYVIKGERVRWSPVVSVTVVVVAAVCVIRMLTKAATRIYGS
jgi:uncharacterized spore protein YtfJ